MQNVYCIYNKKSTLTFQRFEGDERDSIVNDNKIKIARAGKKTHRRKTLKFLRTQSKTIISTQYFRLIFQLV